jgi:hypothetical protein
MKRFLFLPLLLICSMAWASVSYEILKVDSDENGNIRVYTSYKIDGTEVVSRYPQLDGKYYWVTRYDAINFADMTKEEIQSRIEKDLQEFSEQLIRQKYVSSENQNIITQIQTDFVGVTGSVDSTTIKISDTKQMTVDTNGQKTVSAITAPNLEP